MASTELEDLQRRLKALEDENAQLKALGMADPDRGAARQKARLPRARWSVATWTLFNSIDERFCIIEFFDTRMGPLSDYVHV